MRSEAFVVAELLRCLQQQNELLRPNAAEIASAIGRDELLIALQATTELHDVLAMLITTKDGLRAHVVSRDRLGDPCDSLGELALRARTLVLDAQFVILREELRDPIVQARARSWFRGRFQGQGITEICAFVDERLSQIHELWLQYRQDRPQSVGMTDADRAKLYRIMIQVAERELRSLLDEPDLALFLNDGLAATDLTQIHLACRQIYSVVGRPIDGDLVRNRLRAARMVALNGSPTQNTASGTPMPGNDTAEEQ